MKIWREQTDTTWYVIGCEDCDWQAMALSHDHQVRLCADHERAAHPESRTYRRALTAYFPEQARRYETQLAREERQALASAPRHMDLLVRTQAGSERRKALVERYERAQARRERDLPRCVDCGVEIPYAGGRWTPSMRCAEHAAQNQLRLKRESYARHREEILARRHGQKAA